MRRGGRRRASEDQGLLGEEAHPMLSLLQRDAADTAGVAAEGARPLLRVAEADQEPVPTRARGKVVKRERRDRRLPAGITAQLLEATEPPTERAPELHLPLQLNALAHPEVPDALEDTIRVNWGPHGLPPWRTTRRNLGLRVDVAKARAQARTSGRRAEAEPVVFIVADVFGTDLAGAEIPGDVAAGGHLELHPRGHGRHREAQLLLAVEDLQRALEPAEQGLAVELLPLLATLEAQAVGERLPPPRIQVPPDVPHDEVDLPRDGA
mmetsp:Transcript_26226/g.73598  ORF Transcript_26226/g.73598 Transcript_26226/m.73598 type:complete len:266 (+) Transcript_26226:254-1051(+)